MKVPLTVVIEDAAVQHIIWVSQQLARQRNRSVSKAEAIEWLALKHAKRAHKIVAKNGDGSRDKLIA